MKIAAEAAIFFLATGGLVLLWAFSRGVVGPTWRSLKRRHDKSEPWKVEKCTDDPTQIYVQLEKPGEDPLRIGAGVPVNLPYYEFEEQLLDRMVEAEAKADSLNRRLSA